MTPVKFQEATSTLKGSEPAGDLMVYHGKMANDESDDIVMVSKWKMSWPERIMALLFGVAWLYIKAVGNHPQVAIVSDPDVFESDKPVLPE